MSATALRRGRSTEPEEEISRLMECVECRQLVRVYEVPRRFIEEDAYVCGQCLVDVGEPRP